MSEPRPHTFTKSFTALPEHIDELGHVNNSVWVQWIQDLATAHWEAVADPAHQEQFFWVVTRHEIDYRGNIALGEEAVGTTCIPGEPRGAQSVLLTVHRRESHGEPLARVCRAVRETRQRGGRVVAVGTTAVRSLESASQATGSIEPFRGDTDIFIYPGYRFRGVDALVTNFHLPGSTLMMLVCAFGGTRTVMHAYAEAVRREYRFFSYGDAMFLERDNV